MKKIIITIFLFLTIFQINSDETSDNKSIGNKWYSKHSFYIQHTFEFGVSGSKDYFTEYFLFCYNFKSKSRHAFSIRGLHIGYAPGIFSNNLDYFNFAVMAGFEYFYKIFSNTEGLFLFTDLGGCNNGFAVNTGIGIGSRTRNGFELSLAFLQNTLLFSRLDFYFLLFKFFVLRGKIGFDLKYHDTAIELFTFIVGLYVGFSVKEYFRIDLGGGLTANDYAYYSGFGSFSISFKVP